MDDFKRKTGPDARSLDLGCPYAGPGRSKHAVKKHLARSARRRLKAETDALAADPYAGDIDPSEVEECACPC